MKWKTPYNAVPAKGEVNLDPSQTVPDQSMSVQEIMRRYASGLPLGGQRVPVYHGEDEFLPDNFDKLDLVDQAELKKQAAEHRKDVERKLRKQAAEAAKKAKDKDAPTAPPSGAQAPKQEQ